jgi:hypothetical protein
MTSLSNEDSIVWDKEFKVGMFYTTSLSTFRKVLHRLEPDVEVTSLKLKELENHLNSLNLETGIKVRLENRSYSIYNISSKYMRKPENAFKIRKVSTQAEAVTEEAAT